MNTKVIFECDIEHNSWLILALLIFRRDRSSLVSVTCQTHHEMAYYSTKTRKHKKFKSESAADWTTSWTLQTFVIPEDIGFMISALSPFIFTIFVEALFFSVAIKKKNMSIWQWKIWICIFSVAFRHILVPFEQYRDPKKCTQKTFCNIFFMHILR